jgi:hypothetical protein
MATLEAGMRGRVTGAAGDHDNAVVLMMTDGLAVILMPGRGSSRAHDVQDVGTLAGEAMPGR